MLSFFSPDNPVFSGGFGLGVLAAGYITFNIIAIRSSLLFLTNPTWVLAAKDLTIPNFLFDVFDI